MRKVRHLTLVVSALSLGAGLATSHSVSAKPQLELLGLHSRTGTASSPDANTVSSVSVVGSMELEKVNQKVEALRRRTEQAKQQLDAAKAHLRAAEAEYKAARADKEALILRNKATELASVAGAEKVENTQKIESKPEEMTGASPVPGAVLPAGGRISAPAQEAPAQDIHVDYQAPQPATLQELGQ